MRFVLSAYGEYVWPAYFAASVLFISLPLLAKRQRRKITLMIRRKRANASTT